MDEEFQSKLNNNEYISKKIYNSVKDSNIIPQNFDIDEYNEKILDSLSTKYKYYFENMYNGVDDTIKLDNDQIRAILADEDYSLIIAGAGTGKTTTMVSKIKYLVDIKGVDPKKILAMSYTEKATKELVNRVNIDFNIPANVMTFHSLGLKYIKEIFKEHTCYVVTDELKTKIFLDFFEEFIYKDKNILRNIDNIFNIKGTWLFSKYFKNNYEYYNTYHELFESYKKLKINNNKDNLEEYVKSIIYSDLNKEKSKTIKGEITRYRNEALIANYLFEMTIDYEYDKDYEDIIDTDSIYKSTFIINNNLYIEYIPTSKDEYKQNRYNKIKNIKIDYHTKHNNKYIIIEGSNVIDVLKNELDKHNVYGSKKTYEEIYDTILDRNPLCLIYPFKDLLFNSLEAIKTSNKRNKYMDICNNYIFSLDEKERYNAYMQLELFNKFYYYYQSCLYSNSTSYGFDYPDMIYYANIYLSTIKSNNLNFEYIIIDEYQDISQERYELAKGISEAFSSKIVAVGDDWQSIYAFSGSKIEYIYNFTKLFPNSKIFKITNNYRNCTDIINYSSKFIMKNENQIKKNLLSNKQIDSPIKFYEYDYYIDEVDLLKQVILEIHENNPKDNIMILGRTNRIINNLFLDDDLIRRVGTKVLFKGHNDIVIDAMTMHKSKGLTADQVILIGLDKKFPCEDHPRFWIEDLFTGHVANEGISYPEERRVFYVALTRTRNNVYLLINKNISKRSIFVNELKTIMDKAEKNLA